MTAKMTNAAAIAALNAATALVGASGKIRIYSGTVPTDADAALSGNTVLAEFAGSADFFPDATDGTGKATTTANAISNDTSADATGTATFFRILTSANAAVFQGSITATGGGGDITVSTVSIVAGATISITSLVLNFNE